MRFQIDPDVPAMTLMEICGSHTMAIARHGIRQCLPPQVKLISGPGCPVCVTPGGAIDAALALSMRPDVIICSYGDMLRVPGSAQDTLLKRRGKGGDVRICLSVSDAIRIAQAHPHQQVVFLGVGFETTAPAVAATVLAAEQRKLDNFAVFSCHKLVPPALAALLGDPDNGIDAFLLPGHVSTVLGLSPFRFVAEDWKRPAIVAGFEPADILDALCRMARQYREGEFKVENAYPRAVNDDGNPKARAILSQVFRTADALWRGLGVIPGSGLALALAYQRFDALARLGLSLPETKPLPGCRCGEVLKGKMPPNECPLFGKVCTPANPVGPCMVSTEGSCSAYFKYGLY